MSHARLQTIRAKLDACTVLAADQPNAPRFALDGRLDDDALAAIEARLGLTLPADYRAFAQALGTRGPGPDYGLIGLDAAEPGGDGGRFTQPFALTEEFVPVDEDGEPVAPPIADDAQLFDGTLRVAEIGCGYYHLMIVAGPRAGEVWVDYTCGDGSLAPAAPTFLDWYERWLDDMLAGYLTTALIAAMPGARSPHHPLIETWGHLFEERASQSPRHRGELITARLYQGRRAEVPALLDELDARTDPGALPAGMRDALDAWTYADAMAAATARPPTVELAISHPSWRVRATLARNPDAPADALIALAGDGHATVRQNVIEHARVPAAALDRLATRAATAWATDPHDVDALVALDAIARHPAAAGSLLDRLARAEREWPEVPASSWITRAAAMNAAAPPGLLEQLAGHAHPWIRHGVALSPAAPAGVLARLADDLDPHVRAAVARHTSTPGPALTSLARDGEEAVRSAVARNPSAPADLLAHLAIDLRSGPSYAAAHHPRLAIAARALLRTSPHKLLNASELDALDAAGVHDATWGDAPSPSEAKFQNADSQLHYQRRPTLRELIAKRAFANPGFPLPLLAAHLDDPSDMIPYAIAQHPWLDEPTLARLAGHKYGYTRINVAQHAHAPVAILRALLDDPFTMVRRTALARRELDAATLRARADAADSDSRWGVADNPIAPPDLLERLARDGERWVRRAVLGNPATPAHVVDALIADPDPEVRKHGALRPDAAPPLLDRLAADSDDTVRAWATWRQDRDRMLQSLS